MIYDKAPFEGKWIFILTLRAHLCVCFFFGRKGWKIWPHFCGGKFSCLVRSFFLEEKHKLFNCYLFIYFGGGRGGVGSDFFFFFSIEEEKSTELVFPWTYANVA